MTPIKQDYDRLALQKQVREKIQELRSKHKIRAPEFPPALPWLNTGRPLSLHELRGKIVLLDFWTYCCINCMHVIPDLKYLERKYADKPLVVVGVHSAKFTNEKAVANIRQAVWRYEIEHPVLVDSDFTVWQAYAVHAWPTLVLIDPEGCMLGIFSGEGNREIIDNYVEVALDIFAAEGKLNPAPLALQPERMEMPDSFISYPGKIAAHQESRRLAVADSNRHRLLVLAPDGNVLEVVGLGVAGREDGDLETARFCYPQGMAWYGDDLIVCDTGNHILRRIDFGSRSVTTIAGTGEQPRSGQKGGAGLRTPLNSPWDIHIMGATGYIAMAGPHQIWTIDLKTSRLQPFAGSGHEARRDGDLSDAAFAQPSGVTGEEARLFIADSEISSIRQIDLGSEKVTTLVGGDLFQFGDRDGTGDEVRLQHPLDVLYYEGKVFVADTYNHKIKVVDPPLRTCTTFLGTGTPGCTDGRSAQFFEPSGLAVLGQELFIADTNNHLIRAANLQTGEVRTLQLKPLARTAEEHLVPPSTSVHRLAECILAPTQAAEMVLRFELPPEHEFIPGSPLQALVRSINDGLAFAAPLTTTVAPAEKLVLRFAVQPQISTTALRVELLYYYCDKRTGVCLVRQAVYEMPVRIAPLGTSSIEIIDRVS